MRRCLLLVLVSLMGAAPAAAQAPIVEYYHLDATGSVRAVTDQNGTVVRRHDYFPFGEEYAAVPAADPVRFTGKERDRESGLDYFGARYYASRSGRFTTVDPGHVGGNIFDPQSWNAYAYARNNSLRFIDPTGTDYFVDVDGGDAFWFEGNLFQFQAFASGYRLIGGSERGFILNAAGNVVGSYRYFDPFNRMIADVGTRAAPGVDLAVGVISVWASVAVPAIAGIAACAASGPECGASGVAMAALPLKPVGMSNATFGKLIGWTRGGTLSGNLATTRAMIRDLPMRVEGLRRAGVTSDMAREWAKFYRAEAARNPGNPNALPRAELMEAIADLLGR